MFSTSCKMILKLARNKILWTSLKCLIHVAGVYWKLYNQNIFILLINLLISRGWTNKLDKRFSLFVVQWATLVTNHILRAHIFSQKCWNRKFSMIIYLLTFYLFDDIEKNYRNHSCESFCYAKGNFYKSAWLHVQSERLYFLFAFCARHYPWWSLWQKNTKNNYFIQVNPLFRSLKSVTLLLFEEMLVLTSY